MKHPHSILSMLLLVVALAACQQKVTTADAVAYNDGIVDVQTRVVDHFDRFVDAVDAYDSLGALRALDVALDTASHCQKRLDAMPGFEGKTELRDAAKNLVQLYARGLDHDFREILPVLVSHGASLAQLERADSIRAVFSQEEDRLFGMIVKAQEDFSKTYQFEVVAR